ncbi:MAG: hypothetical protein QXG10_04820 [Candidatus Hadarchaeales archaeon]
MRAEYWPHIFWLIITGSWALGFLSGMVGVQGIFSEIGKAVSVPSPDVVAWWQAIPYFVLTVIAIFMLSQIFFGAGSALFSFCRGINDYIILRWAISTAGGMDIFGVTWSQLGCLFFVALVLTVNLPLLLWAAHLGSESSMKAFHRLRGKPWRDWSSRKPLSNLLIVLCASVAAGLAASFSLYI